MSVLTEPGSMSGRAAVVTGGAQGIGLAVCRAFADAGARVVIADLDLDAATAAAEQLGPVGTAVAVQCDVTSETDVDRMVATCTDTFGSVDVLVNNAGITRDGTLRTMSLADFRSVVDVHLQGAWLGTRRASVVMREQQGGSIINMSSIAGKVGNPGQTNYSAAKAGLVGLTKASAKELARYGIRVNAIQPGLIRTPMTEGMRRDIWDAKLAEIPMARVGEPGEVAKTAVYLASDQSSYLTGAVLEVAGGRYM